MFDKTITVFNRYHSRLGDVWYPHIVKGVQLTTDKASMIAKYGAQSSDTASAIINFENRDDGIYIDGIKYLPPKEWATQPNDKLADIITFSDNAQYFDFFIVGEYNEQPINDDDYTEGFYSSINRERDYVYVITSVGGPYSLIPHFEINAK